MVELVHEATARPALLPGAQEAHKGIASELVLHDLTDGEQVGDECRLQDDGHVASLEQLNGLSVVMVFDLGGDDGQVDLESLQEHHQQHDDYSGNESGQVRLVLPEERVV